MRLKSLYRGNRKLNDVARERYAKLFELQNHEDFIREAEREITELCKEIWTRRQKRDELVRYFREQVLKDNE